MRTENRTYRLLTPSWAALERLCRLLGSSADAFLEGQRVCCPASEIEPERVAEAACEDEDVLRNLPASAHAPVARRLAHAFLMEARGELVESERYIELLSERYPGLLDAGDGHPPLSLGLATLSASDYHRAVHEWPVSRLLRWMTGRAVQAQLGEEKRAAQKAAAAAKKRL